MKKGKEKEENENGWDKFLKVTRYKVGPVKLLEVSSRLLTILLMIKKKTSFIYNRSNTKNVEHVYYLLKTEIA